MLVGKLLGDLSYVPMDGIAAVAGQFKTPVIMLTEAIPGIAVNEHMMQRNCYLLRQDQMLLIPEALRLLQLEKRRQAAAAASYSSAITPEEIVRQVYRALLRREASESDVKHHLPKATSAKAVQTFSETIMRSQEFRRRVQLDTADAVIAGVPNPEESRYAETISFGTHCVTGKLLQRDGLKKFSTPFDWIFSTAPMIEHCLEDDFATLLDPAQHVGSQDHAYQEHRFYREAYGIQKLFNHRNPNVEANLAYYTRAVERFRRLARGGDPFLCVMVTEAWKTSVADALSLAAALAKHAPAASLVCIRVYTHEPDSKEFGYRQVASTLTCGVYDFRAAGDIGPLNFSEEIDTIALLMLIRRLRR